MEFLLKENDKNEKNALVEGLNAAILKPSNKRQKLS